MALIERWTITISALTVAETSASDNVQFDRDTLEKVRSVMESQNDGEDDRLALEKAKQTVKSI
jgi:hypothetical protein